MEGKLGCACPLDVARCRLLGSSPSPPHQPSRLDLHPTAPAPARPLAWQCVAGCSCGRSVLDGTTSVRTTLFTVHSFEVREQGRGTHRGWLRLVW